jgi:uncharacterized metal-binding protein
VPSGKTHARLDILVLLFLAAGALACRSFLAVHFDADAFTRCAVVFLACYLFSSFLLSPDLDLARSRPMRHWGPLHWLWLPYAWAFRHRGLSHAPLLGTALRMIYFVGILVLLGWALERVLGRPVVRFLLDAREILDSDRQVLGAAVGGLLLPDLIHITADRIWCG